MTLQGTDMMTLRLRRAALAGALLIAAGLVVEAAETTSPRPAWTTSRVKGAPQPPAPYRIEPAFPHLSFARPTSLLELPGKKRMLLTEIGGKVLTFPKQADARQADLAIDLNQLLPAADREEGVALWSATLHPNFAENRQLFVCYLSPVGEKHNRVSRLKLTDDNPPRVEPGSEQVIITYPTGPHNAGCILFGVDGMLYIAIGDGAGPNPPDGRTTGQDVSDLLGSILRIDVDHATASSPYAVPDDNPFVGKQNARPEIWAYGLRNPWKFGIDRQTGAIFAADNGWESWEMIHRIVRGGNCGWPVMEGRAALRTEVAVGPTPILPPVKDHPHSEANSVIGGPVYRGKKLPGLDGWFVYGDYITGTLWAIAPQADNSYSQATLVDTDLRIVCFGEGSGGELYVVDYDYTGQIYELLPSQQPDLSADFPRRLSETGLFSSLKTLEPAPGVIPYEVKVDRWMDGAAARRWIAIPGNGKATLAAGERRAEFPEGTVLVKQVELPQGEGAPSVRLETQLLHFDGSSWQPYSYLWDESGGDATLVDAIGAECSLHPAGGEERTWRVSATNECRLCHNAGAGNVLGFVPNQLDVADQLSKLAAEQVIATASPRPANDRLALVDPHDASQPLDDRARSYLHANCSMCHHPGGNAIVSFYLRRDLPFEKLNTNKGTRIGTFGMDHAKVIAAGDPFRSILIYRMSKLGYGRMPYIGSQVVDSQGVALLAEWIRSLPADDNNASPPLAANSPAAQALATLERPGGPRPQREAAIKRLTDSTAGSLALLARLHGGKLPAADAATAVALGSQSSSGDIRGLFEHFVPESQRRKRLGPNIVPETILSLEGDVARGKLIYFSDAGRCKACHDFTDASKSLGPTLAEINKKYPRRSEMLQQILQPSLKIDDKHAAYTVLTAQGRIVTGLLLEKTDQQVKLKTQDNKVVTIPSADIDEMQKSPKSLMPEQILSDLMAQEAADLLEYVRSLSPASP